MTGILLLAAKTAAFLNCFSTVVLTETADGEWSIVNVLIISLVVGLICGLIRALSLKGQLTSVYKNNSAADYTRANSFKVTTSKDIFLGSKTETFEKPKDQK